MRVAIHQPEYGCPLSLVAKAARCDTLVLLDDVQFNRASLQHRARICDREGRLRWLTIPYRHTGKPQRICDVREADTSWPERHNAQIQACYGHTLGWKWAEETGTPIVDADTDGELYGSALSAMSFALDIMGVDLSCPPRASHLAIDPDLARGGRVLAICEAVGATVYVSGVGGAAYLDREAFAESGIAIEVSRFDPPPYRDNLPPDAHQKGLSALDAWAYLGDGAAAWLRDALAAQKGDGT